MAISPLMFKDGRQIPFATLQQATLSYNAESEIVIKLHISNEMAKLPSNRNTVQFGNFVFLTTEKKAIDAMLHDNLGRPDMSRLKTLIKGTKLKTARIRNQEFTLSAKDFKFKTRMSVPDTHQNIYQHTYIEESTLRDTKGGSATSGLLTAAHTQEGRELDSRHVSDLYVLVASYQLMGDICLIGNVSRETIMENSITSPTARLYRLDEAMKGYGKKMDVWPGPIHVHEDTIMAGAYHTDKRHPTLTPFLTHNIKIQDLRFLTPAQQLKFENTPYPFEEKPYFSPVTLSRNPSGEILGMFSFDLRSYAIHNARFGGLIKNARAVLGCVRLEDIKLYRRTASGGAQSNELTPGTDMNVSEVTPSPFEYFASLKDGDVQQIRIPGMEDEHLINVVFTDKGAAKLDKGIAEYRVEVIVGDDTPEVLTRLRDRLQRNLRQYTAALKGTSTANRVPVLERLIDEYLTTVSFIFGAMPFAQFSLQNWKKNLLALGAPVNPNAADAELVEGIIKTFAAQISNVLVVGQATTSLSTKNYSKIYNSQKIGDLSLEYTFRDRYVLKNRKEVGFDYMGDYFSPTAAALPAVSYKEMSNRISQEIIKYDVPNPNAASINTYGYMSPLQVRTGLKDHAISTRSVQVDTKAMTGFLRDRLSPTIELAMEDQKSPSTNVQDSLAMAGVAIEPLEESLRELLFPDAQKLSEGVTAANYLSRTSRFVDEDTYQRAHLSGSSDTILRKTTARATTIFAAPLARAVFEKQIVQFAPAVKMTNRTILPGALAVAADNASPTSRMQIDDVSKIVNFDSLVRVEYLKSYDRHLGVLSPQWVLLDEETFKRALDQQKPLICRLTKVEQTVTANNILDMEPLGTLFVLGVPQIVSSSTSYNKVYAEIYDYIREQSQTGDPQMINNIEIYYAQNIPLVAREPAAPSTPATTSMSAASMPPGATGY